MSLEIKDPSGLDFDTLVSWYIQLRDYKSEVKKSIADQLSYADEQMQAIEAEFNKRLVQLNIKSTKTAHGTVSQVAKKKFTVVDSHALRQWVIANPEIGVNLLNASVTQGEVQAYLEESPENTLPDGLALDQYFDISVRRS